MIFDDSVNENKWLLKKYVDVWNGIKNEIKAINGGKENDYGKDYVKIKFHSDDDHNHATTIIIRSVLKVVNSIHKFKDIRFRFELHVCNKCHDVLITAYEF